MSIDWNFPSNNYGIITGIGEAGIETFKGSPFKSLAREICQNSIDARLDINKPVKIEFKLSVINQKELPKFDKLREAFVLCKEFWSKQKSTKTTNFFDKAISVSELDYIPLMRISDFNTTGLLGSDDNYNTPWQNLVKASGVSDKGNSAGGSFGIGKSAPFACSDLRTVFYSTYDKDGVSAFQGIARLVSFRKKGIFDVNKDNITTGIGYYGDDKKNSPIRECLSLDSKFIRNEYGTDVFIIGFSQNEQWKSEMVKSIIEDFLISIYNNDLIVEIDDIIISKETLPKIVEEYKNDSAIAYNYYQVLTSPDSVVIEHEFEGLGTIDLKVLIKGSFHRRVMITRSNGMKIFDQKNISGTIQFAGICVLRDDNINAFFREMENPQHDAWQPERHSNPSMAKKRKQMVTKFIRESVIELGKQTTVDEVDAEGAGEYISDLDEMDTNNQEKKESISNSINTIDIDVSELRTTQKGFEYSLKGKGKDYIDGHGDTYDFGGGDTGSKDHGSDKPTNPNSNGGFGSGDGDGRGTNGDGDNLYSIGNQNDNVETVIKHKYEVDLMNIRLFVIDKSTNTYRLLFIPKKSVGKGYLSLKLSGEQNNIEVDVINAKISNNSKNLICSKNNIYIDNIELNKKNSIDFQIAYNEDCSLEVNLYGYTI